MIKFLRTLFILIVIALQASVASAIDKQEIAVIGQSLDSIEFQTFVVGFRGNGALDESIRRVSKHRSNLLTCIAGSDQSVDDVISNIGQEELDELEAKETKTIEEARVLGELKQFQEEGKDCKLLLDKAEKLLERLTEHQRQVKQEQLLKKQPHFFKTLRSEITDLPGFVRGAISKQSKFDDVAIAPMQALVGSIGFFLSIIIGVIISRRSVLPEIDVNESFSSQATSTVGYLLSRWAPILFPLVFATGFMILVVGYQFTHSNLNQLWLFGILFILVQVIILTGVRRYSRYLKDTSNRGFRIQPLYIRLVIASTLLSFWWLFVELTGSETEPVAGELLYRSLLSIMILLSLIELTRFLTKIPTLPKVASLGRWLSTGVFAISLLLEISGFQSLARFLWFGIVLSAISLTIFYVLEKLLRDFYDGLEHGVRPWQRDFRDLLSLTAEEPVPGLVWFRLLSITALWIGFGLGVMKAWGASNSAIGSMFDYVRNGFRIGDTLISPFNLLFGVLGFAVLLMIFRWFKDGLDKKYLSKSRMDSGAREAMVTITGYLGFIIAAIAGLSIAGFGFSNLAIIAGALSLGIGFGLQNIVNNFVSGIILLFERPIKTGDWIVTGSTEGYVKKISVRSTEVQTFDRSEVIVPNSELISTQVTNWTLRDKFGRVIVPVGVAYGSDTGLVKELLEKATEDIPEIVKNRPVLPVKVLFRAFGDSTLDFELRCFIFDVGSVIDVKSQLHFAIDKAFRENGIEIAFPQRDIHIRSTPNDVVS